MLWKSLDSDLVIPELNTLLAKNSYLFAIDVLLNSIVKPQIFIKSECLESIYSHLLSDRAELGGILIGKTYSIRPHSFNEYGYVTVIKHSLPSLDFRNSPASLKMHPEVWDRVSVFTDKGELVLGWYHSHPNLGAFFSGIDRNTQKHFFNHNYSLGLVVDPIRNEYEIYFGENSNRIESKLRILNQKVNGIDN